MSSIRQFDPFREAVINPTDFISPVEGFPRAVVSTFSKKIVDRFVKHMAAEQIAATSSANGPIPIYGIRYADTDIAFFMSPVGAPAAACILEEVIAMGGRQFVYFGSCGVLKREIAAGQFVVPTAALRDEGTSSHYAEPGDEIQLEKRCVDAVAETLDRIGYPWERSKTWTTDGIYRETRGRVSERKKQGAGVVEMECAALAAVAQFRGVGFAQFLFADDNLDAPDWEPRTLHDHGLTHSDKYMSAALECALALM